MKLLLLSFFALALLASQAVAAEKADPAKEDARVFESGQACYAPGKMRRICTLAFAITLANCWKNTA